MTIFVAVSSTDRINHHLLHATMFFRGQTDESVGELAMNTVADGTAGHKKLYIII